MGAFRVSTATLTYTPIIPGHRPPFIILLSPIVFHILAINHLSLLLCFKSLCSPLSAPSTKQAGLDHR
jgi:hypothetical protein